MVLIFIILAYAIFGFWRGGLKSAVGIGSTVCAFVGAILLSKPLVSLCDNMFDMTNKLIQKANDILAPYCVSSTNQGLDNPILNRFAEVFLGTDYWQNYSGGVADGQFLVDFSAVIGKLCAIAIMVVVLYFLIRIIVIVVYKIIQHFTKTSQKTLGGRVVGTFLNGVRGACVLAMAFCVANLVLPMLPQFTDTVQNLMLENNISQALYQIASDFVTGIVLPWIA